MANGEVKSTRVISHIWRHALLVSVIPALLYAVPERAGAQGTPDSKCIAEKLLAVAKAENAMLTCGAKWAKSGNSAKTGDCLLNAETKLATALNGATSCSATAAECTPLAETCMISVFLALADVSPSPCEAIKIKAAARKAKRVLTCYSKAADKGAAVDPTCLQNASDKFSATFAKAGGACIGDVTTIGDVVDTYCVLPVIGPTPMITGICGTAKPTGACCDVGAACSAGSVSATDCADAGGTLHPDSTAVCSANGCTTDPSPATGGCCDFQNVAIGPRCSVSPTNTAEDCQGVAGVWYPNGICTPDGTCTGTFQCTPTDGLCPHHGACCAGNACVGGVCTLWPVACGPDPVTGICGGACPSGQGCVLVGETGECNCVDTARCPVAALCISTEHTSCGTGCPPGYTCWPAFQVGYVPPGDGFCASLACDSACECPLDGACVVLW